MNLSALPFLAGSVAEAPAGTRACVLVALFCFGQEKIVGVREEGLVSPFKVSSLLRKKFISYPTVLGY